MRSPSEVRSSVSLRHAVAAVLALAASVQFMHSATAQEAKEDVANLSDVNVADDPFRALNTDPSASSFGFAKPLMETPRTVTFVSEEQLRLFGVSTVEDLSRLVPGTYSTTRYGLQGGINVRGVAADFYYRGMKRLNMQGHVRTVLSAYDNIEVIKGPPSPLYGLGKIGGYANLEPKSNRARTGKYKTGMDGYFQETLGNYKKNEMQFGVGTPFKVGERSGGAYFVGLLEDSGTFVRSVQAHQKFIQGTASLDNVIGSWRMETGGQAQNSITTGAYFTRVTKELIQKDQYIAGSPMANLDLNGDGRVGYVETYLASPVTGSISANNGALLQRYTLPLDAQGNPVDVRTLKNTVTGVPQTFLNYLNAHSSEMNCGARYSAMVAAGPVTTGNAVLSTTRANQTPVGFALNPCTVSTKTLSQEDYRSNGAYEREQNATQRMFYFDLINDRDPNFTMKNQFFYDSLISFKDSWLPYGENQSIRAVEDKFTATKKLSPDMLPDWLAVNTLGSANFRQTSGYIKSSGGDFDFRQDITDMLGAFGSGVNSYSPNNMFWTQLTNEDYGTGTVNTQWRESKYTESGIGLMTDIDIFRNTNLLLGARIDTITAESQEKQNFNATTGSVVLLTPPSGSTLTPLEYTQQQYAKGLYCATYTTGCPGGVMAPGAKAKDSQSGKSWSISLSHKLPWFGLVPYVTKANTTLTLDTANNLYTASTIASNTTGSTNGSAVGASVNTGKLLGNATLLEVGTKGQAFRGKLQWTLAGFKQERVDVSAPSDPSASAEVSSTVTKGVEASMNFAATKKLFVGVSGTWSDARYAVGASALAVDVNARDLGYKDILDPTTGQVLIPAEALLYGGRVSVLLTDPNNIYDKVPGAPKWQGALNSTYQLGKGFTLLANAQYSSWSWGSRLQTLKIPESTTINIGATWDSARVHLKGNIYNVMDDISYRATNGSGNRNMASVLPDRRYEASLKLDF